MSVEKQISKIFYVIGNSKKIINEAIDVYDNIEFRDNLVGRSRPSEDEINPALLSDIQIAANRAGVLISVTTAISGHGKKTKSGRDSRHVTGDAVDIALINGKPVSYATKDDVDLFVDELVNMGYVKNRESGNSRAVLTFGFPDHDNHIHVSNTSDEPSTFFVGSNLGTSGDESEVVNIIPTDSNDEFDFAGGMPNQKKFEFAGGMRENKITMSEARTSSNSLFGGKDFKIPEDGSHAGHKGWHSGNAWDIFAPEGTPVYSLSDGFAETFSDYGPDVIVKDGKKIFGQGFTINTVGDLPNLFYTHLKGSPVRKGSQVKCGQLLGYIMDFPGGSDHVHIGVETGSIRQFLNNDGSIKCASDTGILGTDFSSIIPGSENLPDTGMVPLPLDSVMSSDSVVPLGIETEPDFEFAGGMPKKKEFEFAGGLREQKILENIQRIKKLL